MGLFQVISSGSGFSQVSVLEDGVPIGSVTESAIVNALSLEDREERGERPVHSVIAAPFPAVGSGRAGRMDTIGEDETGS